MIEGRSVILDKRAGRRFAFSLHDSPYSTVCIHVYIERDESAPMKREELDLASPESNALFLIRIRLEFSPMLEKKATILVIFLMVMN